MDKGDLKLLSIIACNVFYLKKLIEQNNAIDKDDLILCFQYHSCFMQNIYQKHAALPDFTLIFYKE